MSKKQVLSLWEKDLNRAFEKTYKSDSEVYMDILTLVVFNRFSTPIGKLYKIINNMDTFTQIIESFSDYSFKFPNEKDFKEAIILSLVYYYKEVKHYSWERIQKELPYEKDIPIRYGKRVASVSKDIKKYLDNLLKENTEKDTTFTDIFNSI